MDISSAVYIVDASSYVGNYIQHKVNWSPCTASQKLGSDNHESPNAVCYVALPRASLILFLVSSTNYVFLRRADSSYLF